MSLMNFSKSGMLSSFDSCFDSFDFTITVWGCFGTTFGTLFNEPTKGA
jgi:hypothetical protein